MNKFSERLKFVLNEKHIKAIELSQKTGISKSSISDWINGRYEAKQDKIFLIAEALGVNEGFLLGLDVPMDKTFENTGDSTTLQKIVSTASELNEFRKMNVLEFAKIQVKEQHNATSNSTISLRKYRDEQETSTLIVHGLESAGEGEWQEDDLDMEVQIPITEIPDDYDDLAIVLGDSMRPKLHNGDILFIKFTKQIENGEIGVFRTSRGNFVKKLKNGYLESLNPEYEDIHFCEGEECEAIGVVVDYYRK